MLFVNIRFFIFYSPSLSTQTASPLINSPCQSPDSSINDSPVNSRPNSPMVRSSFFFILTFTTLGAKSADDKLLIFFSYFSISCKLSNCQNLFSGKKNSNLPSMLGPVVQSIISLMSLLVIKMLTFLVSTISNSQVFLVKKMWVAVANAKTTHIFQQKY